LTDSLRPTLHRNRRGFVRQRAGRDHQRALQGRVRLQARHRRLGRRGPPRVGHPLLGPLVQRATPTRPLRRHPPSRVRSSVLRCPTDQPPRGWNPITRASNKPRVVQGPNQKRARMGIRAASRSPSRRVPARCLEVGVRVTRACGRWARWSSWCSEAGEGRCERSLRPRRTPRRDIGISFARRSSRFSLDHGFVRPRPRSPRDRPSSMSASRPTPVRL